MHTSQEGGKRPPSVRHLRLLSIDLGENAWVRFLGGLRQLGTHWNGKRTVPCFGAAVEGKAHDKPYISKWYAAVEKWEEKEGVWRAFALEITENLELHLRQEQELRGQTWYLYREGPSKRSPVEGYRVETHDPSTLPEAFSVDEFLRSFYRVDELPKALDKSPIPDRPVADFSLAPPPARLVAKQAEEADKARVLSGKEIAARMGAMRSVLAGEAPPEPTNRILPSKPVGPSPSTNGAPVGPSTNGNGKGGPR